MLLQQLHSIMQDFLIQPQVSSLLQHRKFQE